MSKKQHRLVCGRVHMKGGPLVQETLALLRGEARGLRVCIFVGTWGIGGGYWARAQGPLGRPGRKVYSVFSTVFLLLLLLVVAVGCPAAGFG